MPDLHGDALVIVVPWYPAPGRDAPMHFIVDRYRTLFRYTRVVIATDGGEPWSKARAVNRAVHEHANPREAVVVADADCIVGRDALLDAMGAVVDGGAPWVVPFGLVYRLSESYTAALLDDPPEPTFEIGPIARHSLLDPDRVPYWGVAGGGILVTSRAAWRDVGGFDERFEGWHGEDASLGLALDSLVGRHTRLEAPLWHLWHPRAPRTRGQLAENRRLEADYRRAARDRGAMRAIVQAGQIHRGAQAI